MLGTRKWAVTILPDSKLLALPFPYTSIWNRCIWQYFFLKHAVKHLFYLFAINIEKKLNQHLRNKHHSLTCIVLTSTSQHWVTTLDYLKLFSLLHTSILYLQDEQFIKINANYYSKVIIPIAAISNRSVIKHPNVHMNELVTWWPWFEG